ncbi:MAG: DUF1501 domain-containing protein [Pseudomonadota bacterium]
MRQSRRQFLKTSAALSLGGAAGFACDLSRFNAFAADVSGYKALVCVFMFGGLDGHDLIIPYDTQNYNQYANVRRALFDRYNDLEGGSPRARDQLLPMTLQNANDFAGRQFAMAPELAPLHDLFQQDDCAVVSNVGPLVEPLNREQYRQRTRARPPRLFSHNDQQSVWMSSEPEGASFGWGGRLADMVLASEANSDATFTAVSISGNTVFLSGEIAGQIEVGQNGPDQIRGVSDDRLYGSDRLPAMFEAQLRAQNESVANLIQRDHLNVVNSSIDANRLLADSFENAAPFQTVFPDSRLGQQMQVVAQMIALRGQLGVGRQIFFVSTGGFDTHSRQADNMPRLQGNIAASMRALHDAMGEIGAQNEVTSFTASDFGRTLTVNRDGTDHGWGGHHLIVGGAVQGGRMVGGFPPPTIGHGQDAGNGRIIPTTSVDQYAATLGGWFGLSGGELNDALPGLSNFNTANLGLFA